MRPAVLETQAGPIEQVARGPRHEHLSRTGQGRHPRSSMDRDARALPPARLTSPVWSPARISTPSGRTASIMATAQRTARAALSNRARNPSPVVTISRPRNRSSSPRNASLWSRSTRRHALSPSRASVAVESTMSVNRIVASVRSSSSSGRSRTAARWRTRRRRTPCRRPPTRHGSAGSRRRRRPRCRAPCRPPSGRGDARRSRSRDVGSRTSGVSTTGLTTSDQRQPGSQMNRPIEVSSRLTMSTRPSVNFRTWSGVEKLLCWRRGTWRIVLRAGSAG